MALKRFECIDVVAMRMGNQDMADSLTLRRLGNGFQMRLLVRARVDNGDIAPANQIGVGAFEGKGSWIVRHDAAHTGRDIHCNAIVEAHLRLEGKLRAAVCPLFRRVHI
jgi:hypothetical protein